MKESQGAIRKDPSPVAAIQYPCMERSSSYICRKSNNSLLLLQLRTELEGKWRPDKFGILRKWMNASPKHWKDDALDQAMRPGIVIRNVKRHAQTRSRKKLKSASKRRTTFIERFAQQVAQSVESKKYVDRRSNSEVPPVRNQRRIRRFLLEEEVVVLKKQLQSEVELHIAFENAITVASGVRPQHPKDLPATARDLLEDIAALENVVAALEEESIVLQGKIGDERRERETLKQNGAYCDEQKPPVPSKDIPILQCAGQISGSRHTKILPHALSQPVTLQDHLSKAQLLETSPPAAHSWKLRELDTLSQESVNCTFSLDPNLRSRCLAELDTPDDGLISEELQAESSLMPSPFSPARISLSGASTSDQCSSLGPSCGPEHDTGTSSPLLSDTFLLPSSPSTPEHGIRPTSPSSASSGIVRLSCCGDRSLQYNDLPLEQLSRNTSIRRSITAEEFFTPKTSIDHPGESQSQPSSAEKRSRVRVKLNLQTDGKELSKEGGTDRNSYDAEYVTHQSLMYDLLAPGLKLDILSPNCLSGAHDTSIGRDYSQTPSLLSEDMMKCMIGIYWHLADPTVVTRSQSSYDSPTSPFGNTSLSSFSEYSLMSFVRSPLVDLRSKDDVLGCESSPDPYRTRGKLPWADIGLYGKVLEVPWMSVRIEHLGYATQSLNKFRYLAEQLSEVNPALMSHSQKLAFWINIFNSLMMHAFLTYGIPRNDLKFLALMQKAVFIVGGHSFNAATIEHSLLKGKTFSYRPQLGLLIALHRNKWVLTEDQSKFAIDYPEPQIIFTLCCGARSSPAVRVYTAGKVHKEMNMAMRDYARATVGLSGKGKLLVPKLLYSYAHDFIDDRSILDWVCQFLPTNQAGLVREYWQQRQNRLLGTKSFLIMPFELNFRYLFVPTFDPSGDFH